MGNAQSPALLAPQAPAVAISAQSAPIGPATLPADPAGSLFDPARHMRVSEVKPGMRGYGLTVFKGVAIERFDVEVLSILKNFNPKHDVVLINCPGEYLTHTGSVAGMSGSPIFLRDDQGRERMIGAFAYGWPLAKDAFAGVQPIEYMLELPATTGAEAATKPAKPATQPGIPATQSSTPVSERTREDPDSSPDRSGSPHVRSDTGLSSNTFPVATWSYSEAVALANSAIAPKETVRPALSSAQSRSGGALADLQPLATPLMASGIPPAALRNLSNAFEPFGLRPMQAGGVSPSGTRPVVQFSPGSVLAVPLLTGDADLTAIGTCTEVVGDRVFGFGHPFNNEGRVKLPMGPGEVHGIVASLSTSFKLGSMSAAGGTLTTDQSVGIAGQIGASPAMAPIDITVVDRDTGVKTHYHFNSAVHPKFTPLLVGVALSSAAGGMSELPQYNTTDWQIDMQFGNGRSIQLSDRGVNLESGRLSQLPMIPLMSASENPFERVPLKGVTATITVSREVKDGAIVDVNIPRDTYRPGEKVKAFVTYKPFRGADAVLPIEMDLPRDLPAGSYQLIVSDADRFNTDEMMTRQFRFTAQRIEEMFDVLSDASSSRHDAIYIRLIRQGDGVAIGRTALPLLPSGRRQILLGSGRSDTTPFVSSATKVIPTDGRVMSGQAQFSLTIETAGKGGVRGHLPSTRPVALPHGEEAKPPKPAA